MILTMVAEAVEAVEGAAEEDAEMTGTATETAVLEATAEVAVAAVE